MSNPYLPPEANAWGDPQGNVRARVSGTAVALMVVSGISIGLLALSLPFGRGQK